MMTTAGRSLSSSCRTAERVVSKVVKRYSPVSGSRRQTTLLYLPRSMARMVFVDAVVEIVFMLQAPRGGEGRESETLESSDYRFPPTACMDSFGGNGSYFLGVFTSRRRCRELPGWSP